MGIVQAERISILNSTNFYLEIKVHIKGTIYIYKILLYKLMDWKCFTFPK